MNHLDTNAYYALGIPAYVLVVLLELWWTRRRGLVAYRYADSFGNLSAGLGEIIIGLFIGPYLIALYVLGYEHYALVCWESNSWIPWVLAFFLGDFCYYWYHRVGHRVAIFWAIHGVHHQSEEFNVTVAMRHPWFSDFYSAPFYAPLPLLGVSPTQFFIAISAISFYSLSIHSKVFQRTGLYIFTTPATHIVHHCHNPRYIGRNLGAMFTLWDRFFGTHVEMRADDPPKLGTPYGYETHSGARAQWIYWRDLWHAVRAGGRLSERVRILFGRPGRHLRGTALIATRKARDDDEVPTWLKLYSAGQLCIAACFSVYILWLRDQHSVVVWMIAAVLVLWSLFSLGSLLDGDERAWSQELLRLSAWVLAGAWFLAEPGYAVAGRSLLLCSSLSFVWLLSRREASALQALPRAASNGPAAPQGAAVGDVARGID